MRNVLVTGGSGKLGRAVLGDLVQHGYRVLNLDQVLPRLEAMATDDGAARP